jgi:hypothetical protein
MKTRLTWRSVAPLSQAEGESSTRSRVLLGWKSAHWAATTTGEEEAKAPLVTARHARW